MEQCLQTFDNWDEESQTVFVEELLGRMCHQQHWKIDLALRPLLMRDFISTLPGNMIII